MKVGGEEKLKADISMTLVHDGKDWVARNGSLEAKGTSLEKLDENLKKAITESGKYGKDKKITVFMGFDYDTIPTWIRQYHTHYFNRFITVEL